MANEELRKIDLASETWGLIRDTFADRGAETMDELAAPGRTPEEYNVMRGKLLAYNEIFALAKPKPVPAFSAQYDDPSGIR